MTDTELNMECEVVFEWNGDEWKAWIKNELNDKNSLWIKNKNLLWTDVRNDSYNYASYINPLITARILLYAVFRDKT